MPSTPTCPMHLVHRAKGRDGMGLKTVCKKRRVLETCENESSEKTSLRRGLYFTGGMDFPPGILGVLTSPQAYRGFYLRRGSSLRHQRILPPKWRFPLETHQRILPPKWRFPLETTEGNEIYLSAVNGEAEPPTGGAELQVRRVGWRGRGAGVV